MYIHILLKQNKHHSITTPRNKSFVRKYMMDLQRLSADAS